MRQIGEIIFKFILNLSKRYRVFRSMQDDITGQVMNQTFNVWYNGIRLTFSTPNKLARYRAETFATKEPETLEWIDSFSDRSVLWDVGSNVGTYSVYAAKRRHRVLAFEPSVFNLELLVRNISLNSVADKVTVISMPLSDQVGISTLQIGNTDWGGALSSFDKKTSWDGEAIKSEVSYDTFGLTIDYAVSQLGFPSPDYIKLDVDGIEHFILMGASETLRSVKGLLVEVNDEFQVQNSQVRVLLEARGLILLQKRHSDLVEKSSKFSSVYNQIWGRESLPLEF